MFSPALTEIVPSCFVLFFCAIPFPATLPETFPISLCLNISKLAAQSQQHFAKIPQLWRNVQIRGYAFEHNNNTQTGIFPVWVF